MRIRNFISKNYKLVIGFIIGGIVFGGIGVYAVTTKEVLYDNSTSKLTSTNMQGAIDELNTKATTKIAEAKNECPDGYVCNKTNIVTAYTYNQTSGASNYCVTGGETTCKQTTCYANKTSGSCPAGTIIKYKVNNTTTVTFHVMYDNGATMTMQSQKNVIYGYTWYGTSQSENNATKGPLVVLPALESATNNWTNVNSQTYTAGTTVFKTNQYTGCPASSGTQPTCSVNTYTLPSRTAKSRMITVQEATSFGCYFKKEKTCPIWMTNYLKRSTSYGGTVNDTAADDAYWTMSANSNDIAYDIYSHGDIDYNYTWGWNGAAAHGARAVVVVNKY